VREEEWGRKEEVKGGESGARRNDERNKKRRVSGAERQIRERPRTTKKEEKEGGKKRAFLLEKTKETAQDLRLRLGKMCREREGNDLTQGGGGIFV